VTLPDVTSQLLLPPGQGQAHIDSFFPALW
jgi:hypothetical protein